MNYPPKRPGAANHWSDTVNPITELDVAKGIQASIGDIDLNDMHGREAVLGLMSALERSLDRIKAAEDEAEWLEVEKEMDRSILRIQELGREIRGKNALQVEAELMAAAIATADARNLATMTAEEEEAFDELEQRASHVCPVFAPKGVA